jgi:tetratricopeptide (TPR) repeat protein
MGFFKRLFGGQNETQQMQAQMNALYQQAVKYIEVEIFKRAVTLAKLRYPEDNADAIGAHVKVYCTGDHAAEAALKNSTVSVEATARTLTEEIMSSDVPGLYGTQLDERFGETLAGLPWVPASIKRLALLYDQFASLLVLSLATDASNPLLPKIDHAYIRERALPLLSWAERYDPQSADLKATIAQTYYSLGETQRGLELATQATELDPDNAECWRLRGNGLMGIGQDAQARESFERALTINPHLDGVYQALALLKK